MIYKDSKEKLLKEGLIKRSQPYWKTIRNLMKRACTDLETANRNLDADEECAYTYAYNAMLRSGLALMFSEGYRPEIKGNHLTIVKFTGSVLGVKITSAAVQLCVAAISVGKFRYIISKILVEAVTLEITDTLY